MQDGHSILRRLLFGSALRFGSYFVFVIISFLLTPYMMLKLGKQDYGLWFTACEVVGTYSILELGLNTAVARFIAAALGRQDDEETNRFFNTGFFLFAFLGTIIFLLSCLLIVFATRVLPWLKPGTTIDDLTLFSRVLLIIGAQFSIELPYRALNGLLIGSMRHDLAALMKTVFALVASFCTFLVLYFGSRLLPVFGNLLVPLALSSLLLAVGNGIVWYLAAKSVFPNLRISRRYITRDSLLQVFKYSSFSFVAMLADILKSSMPVFILGLLLNLSVVAQYKAVVTAFTGALGNLVQQLTNTVSPLFSRLVAQNDHESVRTTLFFAIKVAVVVATFITFGLITWSDPFILRWMGPDLLIYQTDSSTDSSAGTPPDGPDERNA
ncbi:MAG TPA: hypothetical protein DEB39_15855, partial [Planctomycetaceae bacterium]|nr:hypothetical protein [Planctomycetaceae bacterium]